MIGAYTVSVIKYLALICLHGSVVAICCAVFLMTPETANSDGRFLMKSKHLVKVLFVSLIIIAVALLFSSAKVIGMAIKGVIEAADQELIGVDITIFKLALNLFKGYVEIKKLKVCNPEKELIWAKNAEGKME